jgi:dTDP-D-glucose 4,6-dehydratase
VSDVVEGIIKVMNAPLTAVSGEIFNLGDSRLNFPLSAVAEQIREVFPGTKVEYVDNMDRRNYRVSCDKVRNHIGFTCSTTLESGIRELRSVFEHGLIGDYTHVRYHNQRLLKDIGSPRNSNAVDSDIMAAFGAGLGRSLKVAGD